MGTDYIDLFIIHYPNPEISIMESMAAFDFLIDEGIIKNIGLSNFNKEQFIDAQENSKNKIIYNQVHYNLIHREYIKNSFIEYARSNDIFIATWRPLQEGVLARNTTEIMKKMCKKYEKTPSQIAINWLISQKNVIALAGSRETSYLKENLGALGWEMDAEDIEILKDNFPGQKYCSDSTDVDIKELTHVMHNKYSI